MVPAAEAAAEEEGGHSGVELQSLARQQGPGSKMEVGPGVVGEEEEEEEAVELPLLLEGGLD